MTVLRHGATTDVGVVRGNNEDQFLVTESLYAVADGMGGHAAGEVASLAAVETLRAEFARLPHTVDGLIEAIKTANRVVWDRGAEDTQLRGMGTTITVVALVEESGEEHLAIANVGDSRAYLLRDGELGMLTDDHSVAEQLVREGRLTPEEAAVHPQRHVLTRVLGIGPEVEVDCYPILPYRGDRYLLCSDGLINEVSDGQIASVLRRLADPQEAVNELVGMAKAAGGHDNITVVLVDVVDDDNRAEAASAALAGDPLHSGRDTAQPTVVTEADPDVDTEPEPRRVVVDTEAPAAPGPPRGRGVTFRVVLFVLVLVLVLGAAAAAVGYYARNSYYVGIDEDEVVIYQGRPGGLLWFDPTITNRTNLLVVDVPEGNIDDVRAGKEVTSEAAGLRYVNNLREIHEQQVAAGATTTTSSSTTSTTIVADPNAPAITTITTTTTTPVVP